LRSGCNAERTIDAASENERVRAWVDSRIFDVATFARVKINKAVITAAGRDQHRLPLQVLVDSDGIQKPAIQIIIEESISAGIEEVAIIITPGDREFYRAALQETTAKVAFIEQPNPGGYGHALLCAREFVASGAFLHLVSDHVYLSGTEKRCAQQLVEIASAEACSVSAVQPTRESMLQYYGTIGGKGVPHKARLYQVEKVVEKPTPTLAEQELIVPGLRAGYYLCFFGMHVLTAGIMQVLEERQRAASNGSLPLSPSLAELGQRENYLAYEVQGRRYNLGVRFGLLGSQLALGLAGRDREEILAQMVEVLATRPQGSN
jgi:UTP--glucose-1-phosphate uridylyltransferase